MPPAKAKPKKPARKAALGLSVSDETVKRLFEICEHEAAQEAERSGVRPNPRQMRSLTVERLIHRRWREIQACHDSVTIGPTNDTIP